MVIEARNWVREGCDTQGTGDLNLTGPASGKASFAQAFGTSPVQVPYVVRDKTTQYLEAGLGTFDGAASITRGTPRAVLANGVYQRGTPLPINLEGDSEVYCSMTEGLFDDLLQKTDAAATYVPLTKAVNTITGTTELQLYSDLLRVYNTAGDAYAEQADLDSVVTVRNLPQIERNVTTPTVNYTLTLADSNGTVFFRNIAADPLNLYVPTNASVPFPKGTIIRVINMGFHTVTITPVSGVNLFPTKGKTTILAANTANTNLSATLTYFGVDDWAVSGDMTDV